MGAYEKWVSFSGPDGSYSTSQYKTCYFDVEHNLSKHLRDINVYTWGESDTGDFGLVPKTSTLYYEYVSLLSKHYYKRVGITVHEVDANTIRVFSTCYLNNYGLPYHYVSTEPQVCNINGFRTVASRLKILVTERDTNKGVTGLRGTPGAAGTAGTTTITLSPNDCQWDSATSYSYQDIVHYKGRAYKSLDNNNVGNQPDLNCESPAPPGYYYIWQPLTPRLFTIETSPSGLDDDIHIIAD